MIGGMVSSTLLTLIVIPAIYALVKGWRLPVRVRLVDTHVAKEPSLAGMPAE
jgi:Cu(I)/Ag(I) efflux system membrane protein CusA/SilA